MSSTAWPVLPQGVTTAGTPQTVAPSGEGLAGAEGSVSQQPGWWQQLMSPCPATRTLSQPHTLPCAGDNGVVLGVPVLLGVPQQAEPGTASMGLAWGALLHCPPWGKWFICALQTLYGPPKPRTGQQALSYVSCSVSLQIDRVGTALQLPVPPYLEPDALPWGTMAAGGLWDTGGVSCGTWGWYQPGAHSGPLCHCGVQGTEQGCP